jgi:hypothetical protein
MAIFKNESNGKKIDCIVKQTDKYSEGVAELNTT